MKFNDVELMPFDIWTDVISMWSTLVYLIDNYFKGNYFFQPGIVEDSYPETPTPITLQKQENSNNVYFSVNGVAVSIDEKYFIKTILNSAKEFYLYVKSIFNEEFFEARKYMLDAEYVTIEKFEVYNFDQELKDINEMLNKIN